MDNKLILSPPPAKNILLSTGEDVESAINKLNNSISTNNTDVKTKIEGLENNINRLNNRTSINCIGTSQAPEKDRTANRGGLYSYVTYNNSDMPCNYGVTIG